MSEHPSRRWNATGIATLFVAIALAVGFSGPVDSHNDRQIPAVDAYPGVVANPATPNEFRRKSSAIAYSRFVATGSIDEDGLEQDLALARKASDNLSLFYLNLLAGEWALSEKRHEDVTTHFLAAREAADRGGVTEFDNALLIASARSLEAQGDVEGAQELYIAALTHYAQQNRSRQAATSCIYVDWTMQKSLSRVDAADYRAFADKIDREETPWPSVCLYGIAGIVEMLKGSNHAAADYLEIAYNLSVTSKEQFMLSNILRLQGAQAWIVNEKVRALDKMEEGLALAEARGEVLAAASLYTKMGIIASQAGDYERALELYQKDIDIVLKHAPQRYDSLMLSYINVGEALAAANRHEEAIEYFDLARGAAAKKDNDLFVAMPNFHLSESLFALGRVKDALGAALEGLPMAEAAEVPYEQFLFLSWIGRLQIEDGLINDARQTHYSIKRLIRENDFPSSELGTIDLATERKLNRNMAKFTAGLGIADEAQQYAQKFMDIDEALSDQKKLLAVADSDLRTRLRERDQALELAEQDRVVLALELEQTRWRALVVVLLAVLALTVIFALYRLYRNQQKLAKTKDLFLKEIQHRTKDHMQLLVSILEQDLGGSDGPVAFERSTRNTMRRAQTLALVHNHIFSEQMGNFVEVAPFFERLVELLESGILEERLTLNCRFEDIEVATEKSIPLGLILCELITNIQRHAYPDRRMGTVIIRLKAEGTTGTLVVEDDGIGFNAEVIGNAESVGLTLINGLVSQIGGTMSCESNASGTRWTISFAAQRTALNPRAIVPNDPPEVGFASWSATRQVPA